MHGISRLAQRLPCCRGLTGAHKPFPNAIVVVTPVSCWPRQSCAPQTRRGHTSCAAVAVSSPPVVIHDESTAPRALDDVDTLILDCDGVLWRGSHVLPNAPEALAELRRRGKRLLFVTNNSSKSRQSYVSKFKGLGLQVSAEEIVASSYTAAAYLSSCGFDYRRKKVLLLGSRGMEEELTEAGVSFIGGEDFVVPQLKDTDAMLQLQVDPDIGAVLVGWDPHFSYSRLVYASVCLRELPSCLLVATNRDCADHIGGAGRMMPGTGGLVAAVEVASGVKAVDVGKGGSWLLPFLCQQLQLEPSRTAIIGDRMDTDIALGKAGGLKTLLPLTGVTTAAALEGMAAAERPDVVVRSVASLAGLPSSH